MPTDQRLHVFLCHASQDKPIVRALYDALKAEGWIDPWLDEKKLLPGQDWDLEIEKAVEKSDAVIVCLSNSSVTKEGYIQKELRFILDIALTKPEEQIFVIPLRFEDCEPPRRLRVFHYVDYFPKAQQASAYQLVLESLKHRARSLGIEVVRRSVPSTSLRTSNPPHKTPKEKEIVWGDKVTIGGIELVRVPKGKFIMGSNDFENEKPQHTLEIPYDYWMGRFPITNAQYGQFEKKDFDKGKENHPVIRVTWHDAHNYVKWLNEKFNSQLPKGLLFRLPSEAEWEKAARGTDGRIYPWGNTFDKSKCNSRESGKKDTTPVGLYSLQGDSPFACADMAGNVWEWTHSLYKPYPYQADDGRENEKDSSAARALRGGSWYLDRRHARVSRRFINLPVHEWSNLVGFRVVCSPPR